MPRKLIYSIQEHHARNLHWDLRLEWNGALLSFALPKGVPTGKEKRLAIQTEEHEISYAFFEGEIKEGYGKGKVKLLDKGTYEMVSKKDSKMVINIKGRKLNGEYVLLKFPKSGENNWLFFKKN